MTNRTANFEATQHGFRVQIVEAGQTVATQHFGVNIEFFNRKPHEAANAAFANAKAFAAQFGCE